MASPDAKTVEKRRRCAGSFRPVSCCPNKKHPCPVCGMRLRPVRSQGLRLPEHGELIREPAK